MAAKRIVDTVFWEDSYIMDNYTHDDKYFMLYLMTNPRSTQVGIYPLSKRIISFETGYSMDEVNYLLDRFNNTHQHIIYDHDIQELTLLNSLKYTILKGGKPVSDCITRELGRVKNDSLILSTYQHMTPHWQQSSRAFDKTLKGIFEATLIHRGSIKSKNVSNNDNENNNDNESKNEESHSDSSTDSSEINSSSLAGFYQTHFGLITDKDEKQLQTWMSEFDEDIVQDALRRSIGKENPLTYANKILSIWSEKGLNSLGAIFQNDRSYNVNNYKFNKNQSTHTEIIPSWFKDL